MRMPLYLMVRSVRCTDLRYLLDCNKVRLVRHWVRLLCSMACTYSRKLIGFKRRKGIRFKRHMLSLPSK